MKKLLSLLLAAALIFSLAGCSASKLPTYDELRGEVSGDVYTNDYLGLTFTKPSGWEYYSDEDLAGLMSTTADLIEEGGVEVEEGDEFYDMFVIDPVTGNNVNCMLQIVGNTGVVDYDSVLDDIKASIVEYGDAIGFKYTFSDADSKELCGIKFHALNATTEYEGVIFEQCCYIAVEKGVVVNLTVTIMDGTPLETVEGMFS